MANAVTFKINGLTSALSNEYVRITDTARPRNTLYEGYTLSTDADNIATVNIGEAGSVGDDVLIYGDDFESAGVVTFRGFRGAGVLYHMASWEALSNITEIWIYGASISEYVITGYEAVFTQRLADLGHPGITFVDKSVGGRGLTETITDWEAEKATITGRNDILIVSHCIGNTISSIRPWSNLSSTQQEDLIAEYASFLNSVVANGNVMMPVGTSFRDYNYTTINNEEAGSLPFDDAMVKGNLNLLPIDMGNGEGGCYLDLYNFTRNYANIILFDTVHPTRSGSQLNRNLWADSLAKRLSGDAPIIIERVEDPTNAAAIPREDYTHRNNTQDPNRGSELIFGFYDLDAGCVDVPVSPVDGYEPSSVTISQPPTRKFDNGNFYDTGDTSRSLTNDHVKNKSIATTSSDWVPLQIRKGYYPNQEVELEICAYRNWALGGRLGDYSVDGGATFVTIDASQLTPEHSHTFTAYADENGELTLLGRVSQTGTNYECYLSGTHATPK